jgi:uncharacterized membrane protein
MPERELWVQTLWVCSGCSEVAWKNKPCKKCKGEMQQVSIKAPPSYRYSAVIAALGGVFMLIGISVFGVPIGLVLVFIGLVGIIVGMKEVKKMAIDKVRTTGP